VLFGMMGVTCFGLMFTPAFYTFVRKLGRDERGGRMSNVGADSKLEPEAVATKSAFSEAS
jgi:hypothetical protein